MQLPVAAPSDDLAPCVSPSVRTQFPQNHAFGPRRASRAVSGLGEGNVSIGDFADPPEPPPYFPRGKVGETCQGTIEPLRESLGRRTTGGSGARGPSGLAFRALSRGVAVSLALAGTAGILRRPPPPLLLLNGFRFRVSKRGGLPLPLSADPRSPTHLGRGAAPGRRRRQG